MNLYLRKAAPDDSADLARLSGQLGYQTSPAQMEARLRLLLPNPDHHILVAVAGEKIAGWLHACLSATVESDPWVEIAGLVVDETQRGQGIGKQLVQEALNWASTKDVQKVRVRSNTKRTDAHRFYTNLAFLESKEQKVFDLILDKKQRR
ncbi:MAG TPA: GNAT family N-acetyltransferase [Ferruginibacter sp.]|jgi:GNAT superfamily N-acetyltransferase|nr:GNAT family N-acetyltransferase [Ferruginibacter sp.]HMU72640.1 GNAT family N-acetyltransferase [Ferruginibacter sp.]HNF43055.1 GNAT family N-acetyltransferase [Ferruginibacter sp.]